MLGVAALALCALLLPNPAFAKDKPLQLPYKIHGTITLFPTAETATTGIFDLVDVGQSTYLGNYLNTGWVQFIFVEGQPVILDGAGTAVAASGDESHWTMETMTGRVLIHGAEEGRFMGFVGYFDSTLISMTENEDGTWTVPYTGEGRVMFEK
jgi:hypothetical protein